MTSQETAQVLALLTAAYRKAGEDFNEANAKVWFNHLRDVPFDAAMKVASRWVDTESRFPTVAEIRKLARHKPIPDLPALPPMPTTPDAVGKAKAEIAAARAVLRKSTKRGVGAGVSEES